MTLIVAHQHMNLQKSIALTCSAIVLALSGSGLSAGAETRSSNSRRTFADWCREKDSLSPEAKHTVEVLLKEAGTTECDEADRTLSSLTELSLDNNQIRDIKPLASLTNLTWLNLWNNQISDIKPLASLTNLTNLCLWNNQIRDIKPLASLTNLTKLCLINNQISDNQISDIKPLASLTNLISLTLINNQISDIKPLASLTNLTGLHLSGNPIAPKTCPLKPESICYWEPRN
jgi:Leucine-rich repeat (LRR) protein